MQANQKRLSALIDCFSEFGKTKNNGITRLTLSKADIKARKELIKQYKNMDLEVSYDDLGNLYGKQNGIELKKPIVIGSHGDSVEKGGNYDGILGILSAIEALHLIRDQNIQLRHPVILADFTNEEGVRFVPAMFSSGTLAGVYDENVIFSTQDRIGITFQEALLKSGFAGDKKARLQQGAAYLELHVEQGPLLDAKQKQIGVVQGIVGMACYNIRIKGESNHAGSTPMSMRKDPLLCGIEAISLLNDGLRKLDSSLVFTIGHFEVKPNLHTVIPSEIQCTLDMRHQDTKIIKNAKKLVEETLKTCCQQWQCQHVTEIVWQRDTVIFDPKITQAIQESSEELNLSTLHLYSGAGHDAQFLAQMMPTAMIFLPSIGGKSHCEEEYTPLEDCMNGTAVLAKTIIKLDQILE